MSLEGNPNKFLPTIILWGEALMYECVFQVHNCRINVMIEASSTVELKKACEHYANKNEVTFIYFREL